MFPKMKFEDFLQASRPGETSVLFIREVGCFHCEHAEAEMRKDAFFSSPSEVHFYETSIDDEPGLSSKLGLIGVPAFYKIDPTGKRRVKTALGSVDSLKTFIQSPSSG